MSQHRPLPIFATECAKMAKEAGAALWLLEKNDFGFRLRCEKGPLQFSIILPPVGVSNPPPIPAEKGLSYLVTDLAELQKWLTENIKTKE